VHPLAGLGANQGISDAAALSQIINARHSDNRDFSTRSVLRRYERWRRTENAILIDTIDSLQKCFGIKNPVVSQARTAGLNLTARSEILKRKLVHHAIGFGGQTPRLAQQ
jgi:2-polyprenyl-6-methoxyphenol hydroxylase-like FAD-dependent oxidoreductase